ncbi:MAG: phospholipase [Myxococcales bacterium]|nr:phospholipase [Myxococcales bacterium]
MERASIGGLTVWVAGGDDRKGGGDGPAIVLCHGFGASGDDLAALHRVIDVERTTRWFFPEGPLTIDFGGGQEGRAWWPIDMERLMMMQARGEPRLLAQETPAGLAEARLALEGLLADLERSRGVVPERTILGGFSQGAMLTTEIALHAVERPFAGLCAWSGALLCEDRWTPAAAVTGPQIHALVTHGRRDPVLPFAGGVALKTLLEKAGASVRFIEHGGGHEIPPPALDGLARLARERLG